MEICRLQEDIEETSSKLEAAKAKQAGVKRARAVKIEKDELEALQTTEVRSADTMGNKWTMLKALTSFQPEVITPDHVSLTYVGPCPGASVSVSFRMSNGKFVACSAKIDPSVYPKTKPRNTEKYKDVMELLLWWTQHVCQKLSTPTLAGMDVGSILRQANWELERARATADEILKLQRRYDARLITTETAQSEHLDFGLEVHFENKYLNGSDKVAAYFELSELYPFCLMNMQLDVIEGDVDIDDVHANIMKTAKPGYGYLLRICNVIAATVQ